MWVGVRWGGAATGDGGEAGEGEEAGPGGGGEVGEVEGSRGRGWVWLRGVVGFVVPFLLDHQVEHQVGP